MPNGQEIAFDHAWKYFQYHAEQRITVFNFFVATSGLLVGGLAFTAHAPADTWPLGLAAGLLLVAVSLAFWRLDQRVSSMIKLAETVLVRAEAQLISDRDLRMISAEQAMTASTEFGFFKAWTYGRAFRFIFLSMALVGIVGSGFSVWRGVLPDNSNQKKVANAASTPVADNIVSSLQPRPQPTKNAPPPQILNDAW